MKPFNLEKALAGELVVTRSGHEVNQLYYFNAKCAIYPVYGVVDGVVESFTASGHFNSCEIINKFDLFMASTTKEGWVNIVVNDAQRIIICSGIFLTKEMAIHRLPRGVKLVDTIKISWEE